MDQEAQELMGALELPSLENDAKALPALTAMEDLKQEVLSFFKNRISAISRAEQIKELVFQQLENDIVGGELNFEQKMTILMRLARDNNDAADSIISMFRSAGPGQGSLLTDIVRPDSDKSDIVKAFENYTPEELRKVNETMKVIRDIVESGGTVSVETQDGKIPVAEV
jgi:hypothetical protein